MSAPVNQETYDLFVRHLDEMIKVYRHLLQVVRREREILISADLDDLNENNRAKETILLKLRDMEEKRIDLARQLAESESLEPEATRLLEFANHFGGVEGEKLRATHAVFDLILKRLKEFNRQNDDLVHSALNHITGAMTALKDSLLEKPTYEKTGSVTAAPGGAGKLVSREA